MANQSDRQFENLGLLKSLLGEKKKSSSVQFAAPSQRVSPLSDSGESWSGYSTPSKSTQTGASSQDIIIDGTMRNSTGSCSIPHAEQRYEVPNVEMPTRQPIDLAHGIPTSPGIQLEQPGFSKVAPPEGLQRTNTAPEISSYNGLKALFQAPVRLEPASSATSADLSFPKAFARPILWDADISQTTSSDLSKKQSAASLGSQSSGSSAYGNLTRPMMGAYRSCDSQRFPPQPVWNESPGGLTTGLTIKQRSEDCGQPQFFAYQPCEASSTKTTGNPNLSSLYDTVISELEGTPLTFAKLTEIEVMRLRGRSKSPEQPDKDPENLDMDNTQASAPTFAFPVTEPGTRRSEIDSGAWQRRTQIFQMEDPDGHLRLRRSQC
ncbi:hypothetical protein F5Y19DRAFT_478884 [Xylariaceae sp. FL1651]|nr:hypothetical protein F5Y19DRAFT_478884 [Xylariaceae sp. FL1651]